jgi:hypothetical protein
MLFSTLASIRYMFNPKSNGHQLELRTILSFNNILGNQTHVLMLAIAKKCNEVHFSPILFNITCGFLHVLLLLDYYRDYSILHLFRSLMKSS